MNRSLSLSQPVSNAVLYRQYRGGNEANRQSTRRGTGIGSCPISKHPALHRLTNTRELLGLDTEYGTVTILFDGFNS